MKKLAVIFPGVGYHSDKPLLYYAKKILSKYDYEIIEIPYGNLSEKDKQKSFQTAMKTAGETLEKVDFGCCEQVLFVSKSVGTAVSGCYQNEKKLKVNNIYFTPVKESLPVLCGKGIVFTGTKDSWVQTEDVIQTCREKNMVLFITENADHSMETGEIQQDIRIQSQIAEECEKFISSAEK